MKKIVLLIALFTLSGCGLIRCQDTTTITFGTGTFTVTEIDSLTLQQDVLIIEGNGPGATILENTGNYFYDIRSKKVTPALTGGCTRGTSYLTLTDASSCQVGNIVFIQTDSIVETGWNYLESDTRRITFVDIINDIIYLDNPLNFNYTALTEVVTINVYEAPKVIIRNLTFATSSGYELGEYFVNVEGCQVEVSNVTFRTTDADQPDGLRMASCMNTRINNVTYDGFRYGCIMNYCSDVEANKTIVKNCRHAYVPSSWCDGFIVDGMNGWENLGAIDAHPSFNVTYKNCKLRDTDLSNCRSFGVTLENCIIENVESHVQGYSYIGMTTTAQVGEEYEYLFGEYDVYINNVQWIKKDNLGSYNGISIFWAKNVTIKNSKAHSIAIHGGGVGASICNVLIDNCHVGHIDVTGAKLNLSVRNTTIDNDLFTGSTHALDIDGTGERRFDRCKFINFGSGDYLIEYLNDFRVENSRLFTDCTIDTIGDLVQTFQYSGASSDYELGFVNTSMVVLDSFHWQLEDKSYFINCDTTFIEPQ